MMNLFMQNRFNREYVKTGWRNALLPCIFALEYSTKSFIPGSHWWTICSRTKERMADVWKRKKSCLYWWWFFFYCWWLPARRATAQTRWNIRPGSSPAYGTAGLRPLRWSSHCLTGTSISMRFTMWASGMIWGIIWRLSAALAGWRSHGRSTGIKTGRNKRPE